MGKRASPSREGAVWYSRPAGWHLIAVVLIIILVIISRPTTLWIVGAFSFPVFGFIVWILCSSRRVR
ncbi:hypothetical protein [Roseinatronobacter monicus]|uniref:Uncharacterized protein n=1 Tax=Roseinatronobacter monicus TaxID=393481 RepID=A0A543K4W7_9RHOB|nr:hypothetical protein [Roseinatronobacter monicus]TQM90126.1 hypothetical protein BD293_4051 [Roseinatronobacter monicus]